MLAGVLSLAGTCILLGQTPGSKLWDFTTGAQISSSPALAADGTVYVGSYDGNLYALNHDGSTKWVSLLTYPINSSPAVGGDGTIYVTTTVGLLYAVNPGGTVLWRFYVASGTSSSPALGTDGTVYLGGLDNILYAIHPNGKEAWEFTTKGPIHASPIIGDDGTIYVGSRDNHFYAVNPNGTKKWDFTSGSTIDGSAAIGLDGTIYVGSSDARLYALDARGTNLWVFTNRAAVVSTPAVGPDGSIYVADTGGKVSAIGRGGLAVWQTNLDYGVSLSAPAIAADGTLYFGTLGGVVYALSSTGVRLWTYSTSAAITSSSPVIGPDGVVYIGSDNGHLYALAGSAPLANGPWPMFRRDPQHTSGGFVHRVLPSAYSPGETMPVTLSATPAASVSFYSVEETPPSGWQVGPVSDNGYYDSTNNKVRFGPFSDGLPRQLTYQVIPPFGDTGRKVFAGASFVQGSTRLVGGNELVDMVPLHPADIQPADNWLTIGELTAYSTAWKRGTAWQLPPSPVPVSYLEQAVELWLGGEYYGVDTNFAGPPAFWRNPTNAGSVVNGALPLPPGTIATNGWAASELPASYQPGVSFTVTIRAEPATNVTVYAIEDQPPANWTASQISSGGLWDGPRGKVKWGPFFDTLPRTLTYVVSPPTNAAGTATFYGTVALDTDMAPIGGAREVPITGGIGQGTFASRDLPPDYSAGQTMTVSIQTIPNPSGIYYVIEDTPPAGWVVGLISDDGFYDSVNGRVKFGPFFDDLPRDVNYQVTPPLGESGLREFVGTSLLDGVTNYIGGDHTVVSVLPHPADSTPIDHWITIGEVTAYGAAWKSGAIWQFPPNPIPTEYLAKAIQLWMGGEHYALDKSITNAPGWWRNQTNAANLAQAPTGIISGSVATNGTASAFLPKSFQAGAPFAVTLSVVPDTNVLVYAVEDQPPAGWAVSQISGGGFSDPFLGKVKWGPFFDGRPRTLNYLVTPAPTDQPARFLGGAAFDGMISEFTGRRQTYPGAQNFAPIITNLTLVAGTGAQITFNGFPGEAYVLQASGNLLDWQSLQTVTNTDVSASFVDTNAVNFPQQFYRLQWP